MPSPIARAVTRPSDGEAVPLDGLAVPFDGLADIINHEHELAQRAAASAIEHALRAGEHLERVKRELPHGAWAGWLAEHFTGSERTAQRYMRLHRHRGVLEASNPSRVTDMTIRAALAEVASPKAEHPEHAAEDAFASVSDALREIRDRKLYRGTHATFEDYCRERWGLTQPELVDLALAERTTAYLDRLTASGELYDLDLLDLGGVLHHAFEGDGYGVAAFIIRDARATTERYLVCRVAIDDSAGFVEGTRRGVDPLAVPLHLDRLGLPPLTDDGWTYHHDDAIATRAFAALHRSGRPLPPRW
jgi:hypothetical protein